MSLSPGCVVKPVDFDGREHCFLVVSNVRSLMLQAPSAIEMDRWIRAISDVSRQEGVNSCLEDVIWASLDTTVDASVEKIDNLSEDPKSTLYPVEMRIVGDLEVEGSVLVEGVGTCLPSGVVVWYSCESRAQAELLVATLEEMSVDSAKASGAIEAAKAVELATCGSKVAYLLECKDIGGYVVAVYEKNDDAGGLRLCALSVARVSKKCPRIQLRPHVHTRLCDRKERVCTAMGKFREGERLGAPPSLMIVEEWQRCANCDDICVAADVSGDLDEKRPLFVGIEGSAGQNEYVLRSDDVGCLLRCVLVSAGKEECHENPIQSVNSRPVGPVEAGPPKIFNLRIEGDFVVGSVIVANGEYWGGKEGASEYWWVKIMSDGTRNNLHTHPCVVCESECSSEEDPRKLLLTKDDIGARFKVKCRPKRNDGGVVRVYIIVSMNNSDTIM